MHNHGGHSHDHGRESEAASNVLIQPGEAAILPDAHGIVPDEIPPHIAEEMMNMIQQLKSMGQVPADANEMMLMKSMHAEMMKEKSSMPQMGDGMQLSSHQSAPQRSVMIPADVEAQNFFQPAAGSLSGHGHSHASGRCSGGHMSDVPSTENIAMTVMNAIKNNPPSLNDCDTDGDTLLHRVCSAGNEKLARMLLKNGARPNVLNNQQQSPIHMAAKSGQIMMIQLLLDNGGEVKHRDINGWSALHHAASGTAQLCPHTLHYLTECCGLDYASVTADRQTALHIITKLKKDNNREMLTILLSKPQLDIGATDETGCNAVHYAAENCQTHMVYRLVCGGTAKLLTTVNNEGKTPVHIAKNHPKLEGFLMYEEMEGWLQRGLGYKPDTTRPLIYYKYLLTPAIVFLMFILACQLFTSEYQGYLALAGMGIYQLTIFKPGHRLNHISRQANPSRFGGWVSAMVILCYLAVDYDFAFSAGSVSMYDWYRVIHLFFLYVSSLLTLWLFYRLLVMDPGFTLESKRKENGELYTMYDLVHTFKRPGIWCASCQLIPTKPTKHCKLCDRCIHWMDHHCLYTLRCVGHRNHFTFVWFNIVIVIAQILFLSLLPSYLNAIIQLHPQVTSVQNAIYWIFKYNGLLFVMYLGVAGFMIFTLNLLYRSLSNISSGYTHYFKPKPEDKISGLSKAHKLINIVSFLKTGRIRHPDPNFRM